MRKTTIENCTRFITPATEDEAILLHGQGAEFHVFTHQAGETEPMHTHTENHIIIMRSGSMRWTLGDKGIDAVPGDIITIPAGTPHSFEVLGKERARLVCLIQPAPRPGAPAKTPVMAP